jgi:hypothetical protein
MSPGSSMGEVSSVEAGFALQLSGGGRPRPFPEVRPLECDPHAALGEVPVEIFENPLR